MRDNYIYSSKYDQMITSYMDQAIVAISGYDEDTEGTYGRNFVRIGRRVLTYHDDGTVDSFRFDTPEKAAEFMQQARDDYDHQDELYWDEQFDPTEEDLEYA